MPPLQAFAISAARLSARHMASLNGQVRGQWINPGSILDLLLLVGGDVVQVALAKLSGSRWPTPVVFSFGWVAYSFTALVGAIGDNRLLPRPDVPAVVINGKTGYVRANNAWILGRLLRDFEDRYWMHKDNARVLDEMLNPPPDPQKPAEGGQKPKRSKAGLCISVYEACENSGVPANGPLFYLGYLVFVTQLIVAALPWIIWRGDGYIIFVITLGGNLLAFWTGSIRDWARERYACRKNTKEVFVLTRGNGAQHALVILGQGRGLHLEDLATSVESRPAPLFMRPLLVRIHKRLLMFLFTLLWVVLLITVAGIQSNTWFLVAVGGLGSFYSVFAAGLAQKPERFGIPLRYTQTCFANEKVMIALIEAEKYRPGLGRVMLRTFFPGSLSDKEQLFWDTAKKLETATSTQHVSDKVNARAEKGISEMKDKLKELDSTSNANSTDIH